MKTKYDITLSIKRSGFREKTFIERLEFEYNDKNWEKCERQIRDVLQDMANDYINKEFYNSD